ncbi:SusC/RagA family TonB-linked outer membrane protein [Xanthocytophaga flava]|uniref:SusC/RagA family TonB-linked outer membrane protein n=1 Tax=Xanthocytophaga flava TaxID=3048013 RepID=UPI0028D0D591|nr:TonB-dependent receptor [Xanthocytophaga flavus]MDJ1467068.1 TonB-dependent receptor [Xanthocytophaga flavus]
MKDLFLLVLQCTCCTTSEVPDGKAQRKRRGIAGIFSILLLLTFSTIPVLAQNDTRISGTITNENGEAIPGVSIRIKENARIGTVTDVNGKYELSVPKEYVGSKLVISYVGYNTEELDIANQTTINVKLLPNIETLGEIVVVGYGTQQKKDITGAVATISSENLNQGAVTNPLQQIAGRAAGVNVSQTGSEPGSAPSVRIRGITSLIGGNDPLVVVDGIQGNMDLLNQVPPNEIESIDILKDASATAIYGSRGAPGVIIVTTKKGKEGKTTVEYSATASADFIPRKLDVLGANEWWEQAQLNGVPASANHGSSTDWYNILTRTGNTQNHTLSFGGGLPTFSYRASVTAILQNGVVLNSSNRKYIARVQATQRALDDKLTLTINLNNAINNTTGSPSSVNRAAFSTNLITNAYLMRPTDPVYNTDGSYYTDPNVFEYFNPYAISQTVVNEGKNSNLFGSLRADLEIVDGLTAGWFGSWRKTDNTWGYFLPAASTVASAINNKGIANITNNRQDEKLMDISLNYQKKAGQHMVNGLAVYEWQNQTYQGNYAQARGFVNDIATYNALQLGDLSRVQPGDMSSYKNDRTLVSFLGRVNYSFADRYLFTVSFRRDGSSVFGKNNKWGNFPSASVAWQLHQESFMAGQKLFDQLKLRAGYGVTGNQQGLYPQNSLSLVGAAGVTYFGGSQITNFTITQNVNEDLRWETRKQANIGIDFALLDSRLSGSIDAFTATTDNLLFNYSVPQPPFPYGTIIANVGSILNKGLELSLSYQLIKTDNTTLTLAGNVSLLRNEVLELSGSINGVPLNTDYVSWGPNSFLIKGKPIGTFFILQHTGKTENNAETVADRDGNGIIDQGVRSPDRAYAGNALPTHTYAFTPTLKHKNLDVTMVWRGSGGNKIYNGLRQNLSLMENIGKANVLKSAVADGIYTTQYGSDLWLENGSYLRLDNVTVGYTIRSASLKYIDHLRIALTANNLALITRYSGVDPELNVSGGNGFGGDNGIYPRTRSIALGLNVVFK